MYTTCHFKSAADIDTNIIDAIKASFKGKPVVITVEEETDETSYLMSDPANNAILLQSIAFEQYIEWKKQIK